MIGDHHFIKVFKVQVQFFVFEKQSSQSINHVKEKPRLMLLHIKDLSYREKFAGSRSVAPKHRQFFFDIDSYLSAEKCNSVFEVSSRLNFVQDGYFFRPT